MKIFLSILIVFATSAVCAQSKLTIVVDGIDKTGGRLLVAVYDSAYFLQKPDYVAYPDITGDEISVVIHDVAPGDYAVAIIHDENSNNKLDTGSHGIPVEKTGFSNNARDKRGAPDFDACKFTVNEDCVIYITLWKYEL
jgi:uncharacterized protein (DUF2141 family)